MKDFKMVKIGIFKNEKFSKLETSEQFMHLGIACYILSNALNKDRREAMEFMSLASKLYHPADCDAFNELYSAVAYRVTYETTKDEFYWQEEFKNNINYIIPNSKIVNKKSNGRDIPDAWVDVNGLLIPVEVKLGGFNIKAKKQLMRYMKAYNCGMGIAVAQELTTELPENILFISHKTIEKASKNRKYDKIYKEQG